MIMNKSKAIVPIGSLRTAVLFLVFNRLNTTIRVFESIRHAKPPRLYIGSDGPRCDHERDAEAIIKIRSYILEHIDWPCEVRTLFREKNLGCKMAVSDAISWFFRHEEMGIVLEDDCLPQSDFFKFCQELLVRYRDDSRIMMISGTNMVQNNNDEYSYFFSKYPHIWGWASWSRVWKRYDVNIKLWPEIKRSRHFTDLFESKNEKQFWFKLFNNIYSNKIDTWDAQVSFLFFMNNALTIFPKANFISNIGFDSDATHTRKPTKLTNMQCGVIPFPLKHPPFIKRDVQKDKQRQKQEYCIRSIFKRLYSKLVQNDLA